MFCIVGLSKKSFFLKVVLRRAKFVLVVVKIKNEWAKLFLNRRILGFVHLDNLNIGFSIKKKSCNFTVENPKIKFCFNSGVTKKYSRYSDNEVYV